MEPKVTKLELIHTNVWGPSLVTPLGDSNDFVTIINDSSRKLQVYFLKNKSDCFDTFKRWKTIVKNVTNFKLKDLYSDNGEEYVVMISRNIMLRMKSR